jgi:single-strand DNA-binding protein
MAKSMNKVTLLGNLGSDPEISTLPSGTMLAKCSLATTDRYQDKASGEWKEQTEWHRLVFWDGLAKTAGDYLKKGSQVLVEGKIKYGQYSGNDGITRYTTDIQVRDLYMLGKREDGGSSSYNLPSNQNYQQSPNNYNNNPTSAGSIIAEQLASHLTPDTEDDDIPF